MLNKLVTRLSILLAQVKAVNNSNKLKNEIKQIYLLDQYNKTAQKFYFIKLINQQVNIIMGVHIDYIELTTTTEPKTFCFDLPKDADKLVTEWNWFYHKT